MADDEHSGGLFRNEFLDKGLVTFAECAGHYGAMETAALLEEMRVLFGPAMRSIPFAVSGMRYVGLAHALIRHVADERDLSDRERTRIVNICIDLCAYVMNRTADNRRGAYEAALAFTLDSVSRTCRYPQVAELVARGTRDFGGQFEAGARSHAASVVAASVVPFPCEAAA